jgi:acyl carrier protein phosphodiesterase
MAPFSSESRLNFLAHALLAGDEEADRIGGLMGDFVKGLLPAGLPPDLASGVALHRAIDGFADRHPAFAASRARISPLRRRLGGVLVDLFYDHLLARDWAEHGVGRLEDYVAGLYRALDFQGDVLPARAVEIGRLMRQQDWLCSYREVAQVGLVIDRMSIHRLRRANSLAGGIEEFLADSPGFERDFRIFLPDALAFASDWRARRLASGEWLARGE